MSKKLNFKQIVLLWQEEKHNFVKRSTMSAYLLILENHLLPVFEEMYSIEEEMVQSFVISKLKSGLSQKSVKDMLIVLKMVVRYGVKHGDFSHPDWDIKFPTEHIVKELPVFTIAHQRKLMAHITANFTFKNLGVLLCLHTGMRIGEVCALTWADIDVKQGLITVSKTIERLYVVDGEKRHTELVISTPKTKNSHRDIPMTRDLLKLIKPLKTIVNNNFYVLTNEPTPTEPRTYRNYYKRLLRSLNIPELRFHGLRHSFATRCIESNCDYKTVSVILGHANVATTLNLYVHPNFEQKKRCIDKMIKSLGKI
ncbi:MAG: site-specific integrase [Muribaculaceae bacterium]|nr:site-specific integrase [Muribaculaceae bacterium]